MNNNYDRADHRAGRSMTMTDNTRELIAEARQEESIQDKLGDGFGEGSEERAFYYEHRDRYKRLADALEAATRERDAAVAAVGQVRAIHRKYTYYDLEDSCPDTTDEHREEHHHEASDDIGEFYCDQMPTGDVCCGTCRDVNGDRVPWPCPTAVSLGLNEGENDD